jgi:hypothetical protein
MIRLMSVVSLVLVMAACGGSGSGANGENNEERNDGVPPITRHSVDTSCDVADFFSAKWAECELANWQLSLQGNLEQLNPAFQLRSQTQQQENRMQQIQRFLDDPSWNLPPTQGNTIATPLCSAGMGPCVGDPFRYPGVDGADGKVFYEQEAEVVPVVYYDQACARTSGHVWRPRNLAEGQKAPMIVIKNGSVQASEELYWWAAQPLVRAGYVVLTSDPRGQGDSDMATPNFGEQGGNINGRVFYEGLVNDIDFMLSSPNQPYPHEQSCADTYPTVTATHNPFYEYIDAERLGIAGHSYGAGGVTWVQSYGAEGAEAWPGLLTQDNPVDVVVAWDALGYSDNGNNATLTSLQLPFSAADVPGGLVGGEGFPTVVAHKPALSFKSEYGFTPVPFISDPDRELHKVPFVQWQQADVPVVSLTIAGSTHLDYSLGPDLPATSWCPEVVDNACVGGWARPMITEYTVAWFDRWLKQAGEQGYEEADARLLNDAAWADRMSMHFASARDFPTRGGQDVVCDDIRLECGE